MAEQSTLLSVKDLEIAFQTPAGPAKAVNKISFDIKQGEIFALVGESGCGKSSAAHTVMRLINSINAPGHRTGGSVCFKDKDLLQLSNDEMCGIRGKEISMIFQNPLDSLNPLYKAGYQVYEAIVLDKTPKIEAWQKVESLFRDVRISDPEQRIYAYPQELSGGMRQRVMIGMMLSRNPQLLIADEPTTALDVTIQAQILDLIKSLRDTMGMAVWVITHDFGIVAEIADRVGVMYAGVLVEEGDVFEIFDHPKHPYTRMLLESLPQGSKNDKRLQTIPGILPNPTIDIRGCRFEERCPFKFDKCEMEVPPMQRMKPGHYVACHLTSDRNGDSAL